MRVLIIEDEAELSQQLRQQLESEGYRVDWARDGKEGLYIASEYPLDAAIIDLGLPGLPGLDIIRQLRARGSSLPILILTARGRWQERVEGLETGADDYLVKPFQMEELSARLKALVRRALGAQHTEVQCGHLSFSLAAQRVKLDGKEVDLTAMEYQMLEYMVRRKGTVVSKNELRDYLYPHDSDPESNVIEVLVGRLRRKLDPSGTQQPIETLRGRGYRLSD